MLNRLSLRMSNSLWEAFAGALFPLEGKPAAKEVSVCKTIEPIYAVAV